MQSANITPDQPIPIPTLTPEEIDSAIESYESALLATQQAGETLKLRKQLLMSMVLGYGHVPPHAEQSHRLLGKRHVATVTQATIVEVDEDGARTLESYLQEQRLGILFERFFRVQVKHTLVDGARDVLKTLELARRVEEKIQSLFGRSIQVKTKAPSLKVETIAAEKPAKTPKPRGTKAVAA